MENLEAEISAIKERNKKVEADKAWEQSWTRRISIVCLTYVIALVWLLIIHEPAASLKAFVPVAGYMLSTLSLPFIKKIWIENYMK